MELEILQGNTKSQLRDVLEAIKQKTRDEQSGKAYVAAAVLYRRLAICEMLLEARTDRFYAYLHKSALARLHFLQQVTAGHAALPITTCASFNSSFIDGVVAGQFSLALELARLTPDRHQPSCEYEEDFLLHRFLHKLTLNLQGGEAHELAGLLERWEVVIEGNADPYLDICRALLARDAERFDPALLEAIAERRREFEARRSDLRPDDVRLTEGVLFMNGLALLRLAELSGMLTQREYPTIPRLARLPCPPLVLAPHSWREPEAGIPA
jgi:hypothetical protein